MLPRIKRLSLHEAQKIAAGEVVERPASVIKELLENALDAGATTIELSIHDAGKTKIRIIDNGCGMVPEDARLCTQQYTTSKITSVDQLPQLTTFGFRGEALASIAAVSRCTITTKDAHSREGIRIRCVAGEQHEEVVAASQGTDIVIEELFYNVPARRKFLKKAETEWRQIMTLLHAFCLNHPEVHFKITHDDALVLSCPATTKIQRIAQLWDSALADSMLPLVRAHTTKNIAIQGFVSHHQVSTFDRSSIFLFVNNRWIKNQSLSRALLKGYMNVLPPGRYPRAALFIEVDPETVDINIHPRKEEVLLLHAHTVEQLIHDAVRDALEKHLSKQLNQPVSITRPYETTQPTIVQDRLAHAPFLAEESFGSYHHRATVAPSADVVQRFDGDTRTHMPPTNVQQLPVVEVQALPQEFTIVGCYKKTYILVEKDDGLCMIDQHAAHERILYEQFTTRFNALEPNTLLFPVTVTITADELAIVAPHSDLLARHGIIAEPFGSNQLIVTATPVCLVQAPIGEIIRTFVGWILEDRLLGRQELQAITTKKMHAMMACKAAVKAGDQLSMEHMAQLLRDLHTTPNNFTCPHGRPTCWLVHHSEIEKKFKRRS